MDSELTSIASVKALNQGVATGDSPTFAGLNASGDLTLDVAGDIILDADGDDIQLKAGSFHFASITKPANNGVEFRAIDSDRDMFFKGNDGGSEITALTLDMSAAGWASFNTGITLKNGIFINNADASATSGYLYNDSNDFVIRSYTQDKDLIFKGNDGGSVITALSLDMSAAGAATFNDNVYVGGDLFVPNLIYHTGDLNTYMQFHGADSWRVVTAGAERFHIEGASVVVNHDGHDADFRVESNNNDHMLFVDGGEDIVSMGMPAGVPSWIGGNSVVVADNIYAFQGASYSNACFNLSVDNNFTYLLHNAYYGAGWKQRLTGYAPTMLQTGSAAYNFNYAADTGSDASISWISLMALNSSGAIFNEAGNAGQDFRVESDAYAEALLLSADVNRFSLGQDNSAPWGQTSGQGSFNYRMADQTGAFSTDSATGFANIYLNKFNLGADDTRAIAFYGNGNQVGTITVSTSATAYNTSSDQRLKENIVDAPSSSDAIDAIQVRSFDWKADGEHQRYGMVAQELQPVAPEAVSAPENPDEMMGVDYSKLVPMLIKEIQSLRQRVAQLEE